MESKCFGLFVLLLCGLESVSQAHNWLDTPVSRGNQRQSQTGCRYGDSAKRQAPTCGGPCDRTISQITIPATAVQRGEEFQVSWNMHNHPGGFVRFAWCPTSQSDSHECFNQYVTEFTCKQHGGCTADSPLCNITLTVPAFATNGAWTFQWAYFGGYYNAGDYYACVDYSVNGGTAVAAQDPAIFVGGDTNYPNQDVCLFYTTNELGICTVEPCTNGTFPLGVDQVGVPVGFTSGSNAPPSAPAPVLPSTTSQATTAQATTARSTTSQSTTSKAPQYTTSQATTSQATQATTSQSTTGQTVPSTTGQVIPSTTASAVPSTTDKPHAPISTTGRVIPSTTGRVLPSTTGRIIPSTTGAVVPSTTASPVPSTTGIQFVNTPPQAIIPTSAACSIGSMKCVTSETFSMCDWGSWSATQRCATGTTCQPNGDYIICGFP